MLKDSMDMNLSELWEIVKDRERWQAAVCGVTELDTTKWLNNSDYSNTIYLQQKLHIARESVSPGFWRFLSGVLSWAFVSAWSEGQPHLGPLSQLGFHQGFPGLWCKLSFMEGQGPPWVLVHSLTPDTCTSCWMNAVEWEDEGVATSETLPQSLNRNSLILGENDLKKHSGEYLLFS